MASPGISSWSKIVACSVSWAPWRKTGPYIAEAPLAIVVVIESSPYAVSDASRAIQSMLLTAWAEGLGSNWVGFQGLAEVKPLLGFPPDLDILAILPFGYPVQAGGQGKKRRKPLAEIAHRGRFGQPFVENTWAQIGPWVLVFRAACSVYRCDATTQHGSHRTSHPSLKSRRKPFIRSASTRSSGSPGRPGPSPECR